MNIPPVPKGMKRQWVRCKDKKCKRVFYYDYVPYGISNPIMTMPCGHGIGAGFNNAVVRISADEAAAYFANQGPMANR